MGRVLVGAVVLAASMWAGPARAEGSLRVEEGAPGVEPGPGPAASELDPDYLRAVRLGIARQFLAGRPGLDPVGARRAATAVVREARAAGFDPLLITAVIEVESGYRPGAVSSEGAVGLMQLMPATATWFGERVGIPVAPHQLVDPEQNIRLGVLYLRAMLRRFGSLETALVAYNVGPGRTAVLIAEGRLAAYHAGYAAKVLATRDRLRGRGRAAVPRLVSPGG